MQRRHLGEFEELVLLTTLGLKGEAYGVPIVEKLEEDTGRRYSLGAVYAALVRLEDKGHLRSWVGGATAERGGRRKRFYKVTRLGAATLQELRSVRNRIWKRLDRHKPKESTP